MNVNCYAARLYQQQMNIKANGEYKIGENAFEKYVYSNMECTYS